MATHVPFTPLDVPSRPPRDIEPQGMLFRALPRGLPLFKEEPEEGAVFRRLANRGWMPLPAEVTKH